MHTVALHLAPVLAAEKSKVPFYIAAGLLVAWALILSLGIGSAQPSFPSNSAGQRAVIAITAVLVLVTAAMAVATSGSPAKGATQSTPSSAPTDESPPQPEVTSTSTSTSASSETPAASTTEAPASTSTQPTKAKPKKAKPKATKPTATTGTPAPSSSPAAKPAASSLSLAADPAGGLSYNTKSLSAKAGTVTITMANMSPVEHNVTIAQGTTVLGATPTFAGGSKAVTIKLKPGKYTFYCSVPGHRAAGMEGTLTIS